MMFLEEEQVVSEEVAPVVEESTQVEPPQDNGEKKVKKPKSKLRKTLEWVFTGLFAGLFVFLAIGQIDGMIHKNDNYGYTLTYGTGNFIIKTNSMEPEYPVYVAIVTHRDDPQSLVDRFDRGEHVDLTFVAAYSSNNSKYDYTYYRPGDIVYDGKNYPLAGKEPTYPTDPDGNILNYPITHRLIDYHIDTTKEVGQGRYTFVVAGINDAGFVSGIGQYQLLTENELLGTVKIKSNFLGKFFEFITSPWGLLVFLLIPAFYLVITSVIDIFKAIKEPDEATEGASNTGNGVSSIDGLSEKDKERLKQEMLEEMMNKKGKK